ncbi:hypothetical protein OAO18_07120 [Francisellaceae bacterium]|nr:hypothetical protein [Francisellaceae bacterium]
MFSELYDELYTFFKLVQYKSTTSFIAQEGVGKAQVWRHIDKLENTFGVKLVLRYNYGFELTNEGLLLYNSIFMSMLRIEADLKGNDSPTPTVTILSTFAINTLLLGRNSILFENNDEFKVKLLTYTLSSYKLKAYGEVDDPFLGTAYACDILICQSIRQNFFGEHLWEKIFTIDSRYKLYVSEAYIQKYGLVHHVDDLKNHSCISNNSLGLDHWRLHNIHTGDMHAIKINVKHITEFFKPMAHLIENGEGIGLMSQIYAQQNNLINVLPDYYIQLVPFSLYKKKILPEPLKGIVDKVASAILDDYNKLAKQVNEGLEI